MELIKLQPACKDYIWGGDLLQKQYHKGEGMRRVAESWELSAHPAGESIVSSSADAGMGFTAYLKKYGKAVLGANGAAFTFFPVLIKWIDAHQPLSVQVHPSDEYALRVEGEYGKTEMWYVMDCQPNASLYFGVNQAVTPEELRDRIENNTLTEVLNEVPVHPGDVFFIESGTLHAIGAGILICEIQQNSNTTYRVYDYGRRDDQGNLRELHIDKALAVTKCTPSAAQAIQPPEDISGGTRQLLAKCPYFTSELYEIDGTVQLTVDESSFTALSVLKGTGTITGPENTLEIQTGDSIFIPAGTGEVSIKGDAKMIRTRV